MRVLASGNALAAVGTKTRRYKMRDRRMRFDTLETMDLCKYADLVADLEYCVIAAAGCVQDGISQQYPHIGVDALKTPMLHCLVCNNSDT